MRGRNAVTASSGGATLEDLGTRRYGGALPGSWSVAFRVFHVGAVADSAMNVTDHCRYEARRPRPIIYVSWPLSESRNPSPRGQMYAARTLVAAGLVD